MIDIRVHDICFKTNHVAFSEPGYGFIEDCKNVYNLPKDLSFGWGVITDGGLVTPTDADYITPTNMATGSGWHGPNFVHVLEQPIRLHELGDFAVTGEMVQSDNTLGEMNVALFDENKQIVMNIYWRDAWVDSQSGYFGVTYYPEGGSASGVSTGYINNTTFLRTGRMWYEDGTITYEIENTEGVQSGDLGPVGNPYKLIKYVVIRPSKSGNFAMVDLRIHQISVVSNFRVPTQQSVDYPAQIKSSQQMESDGTLTGASESSSGRNFVNGYENSAKNAFSTIWLLPWPMLQITCNLVLFSLVFVLVITIDILGSLGISQCSFSHPYIDAMTQAQQEEALGVVLGLDIIQTLKVIILASSFVAMFFSTFQLLPYALLIYAAAMITWTFASLSLIYFVAEYFINGRLTKSQAAWSLFALVWGLIIAGTTLSEQGIFGKVFSCLNKYRVDSMPDWGFHTTFYWASRLLVVLLGFVVVAAILASPS